jgi:hypothetical protein
VAETLDVAVVVIAANATRLAVTVVDDVAVDVADAL